MYKTNFKLQVVSREGMLFEGEVNSITSYNEKGVFDVLAQHANFISLINKGITIRDLENNEKEIKFDNALLKVFKNNVEVYVGVEGMSPSNLH
jgi:F0F1-type ATP synthase epsilon subunit